MSFIITTLLAIAFVAWLCVWAIFRIRKSAASYTPENPTWWTFAPANMGGLVVGEQNVNERKEGTGTVVKSGGGITNMIHSIPGKKRQKVGSDPTAWPLIDGEEDWGFIHWVTGGAFFLGPLRKMRNNTIHEFSFAKKKKKDSEESGETDASYHIESRDYDTTWVHYSGALAIMVREAETQGTFTVDIDMNVIYERKFFARSLLRVADANAQLTIMANKKVVDLTGTLKPEDIVAGAASVKDDLANAVMQISPRVEEQIGLAICDVENYSFDIDDEERRLLELAERTKREQAARIQVAETEKRITIIVQKGVAAAQIIQARTDKKTKVLEGQADRAVGIMKNDVAADNVTRVIIPVAEAPLGPAVRLAEAIEKTGISVWAPGNNGLSQILPSDFLTKKAAVPAEKGVAEES